MYGRVIWVFSPQHVYQVVYTYCENDETRGTKRNLKKWYVIVHSKNTKDFFRAVIVRFSAGKK